MSSERLNRTVVTDARLKDLLLERGTRSFVRRACAVGLLPTPAQGYRDDTR